MIQKFRARRLRVTSGGRYVLDKCPTDSEHMAAPLQPGEERRSCQLGIDNLFQYLVGLELHIAHQVLGDGIPGDCERILITTRAADRIEDLELAEKLCAVLINYVGETSPLTGKSADESALDVLKRIVAERAELLDIVAFQQAALDAHAVMDAEDTIECGNPPPIDSPPPDHGPCGNCGIRHVDNPMLDGLCPVCRAAKGA